MRNFIQDLTDHSAKKVSNPNWAVDGLTTLGIAALAASGQVEAIQKLASQMIGDFSSAVQLLLLVIGVFWCTAVISAKTKFKHPPGIAPEGDSQSGHSYVYSQLLRTGAKAGLMLFLVAVPFKTHAVLDELLPLPTTIYGYVFYDTTKPVDGANIRIVSSDGSDITVGSWVTDSKGFYTVKATRHLRRSDVLRVMPDGCTTEISLPLKRPNEGSVDSVHPSLSPLFIHRSHCEESK